MAYERALGWAKTYSLPPGGISQTSRRRAPYPEVTGYFVPTLYEFGERELALRHARWIARQLTAEGAISGPNGLPYTFDTAQALRAFLAGYADDPDFGDAIDRAAEFVSRRILPSGKVDPCTEDSYVWHNERLVPQGYLLYTVAPLKRAAQVRRRADWAAAAERAVTYYLGAPALLDANQLSHFYAYVLEALVELGATDEARTAARRVFGALRRDGSLPAYPGVSWTCSTGNIQFALIGYRVGLRESAERIYRWAESKQTASGGFLGSYGRGAAYSADEEISWAVKYFLDATLWRVRSGFAVECALHPDTLEADDPRLGALLRGLGALHGKRVLDLGCGKGRFGKAVLARWPTCLLQGVDASPEMLAAAKDAFPCQVGSMLRLPFSADTFDAAYAVESFEHVLNARGALREVYRCLKAGGRLVVIDKDAESLGTLDLAPWERWFALQTLCELARAAGLDGLGSERFYLASDAPPLAPAFFACVFQKATGK